MQRKQVLMRKKVFLTIFWAFWREEKIEVECNEKDLSPIDYLLKYHPESRMYVTRTFY